MRLDDDGIFFHQMDSADQPTTTMWIADLQLSNGPDGVPVPVTLEFLKEHITRQLDAFPTLRWCLHRVPLGLHLPVIAEDDDFDIDFHVRGVTLPDPGGEAKFDELVAQLNEQRIDLTRPIWDVVLVDGVAPGRQAVIARLHHAFFDGGSGLMAVTQLLSDGDEPVAPAPPKPPDCPGPVRMVIDAFHDHLTALPRLFAVAWSTLRGLAAIRARRRLAPVDVPRKTRDTPACALNGTQNISRSFSRTVLPVGDIMRVKDAAGVTLSSVLLALVSGSFRSYLLSRNALPSRSLTANLPVSSEPPGAPARQWGNRFGNFMTSLATDEDDPWERLQKIAAVTKESKAQLDLLGVGTMSRWSEFAWPFLGEPTARILARSTKAHPERAESSVILSNVKGGTFPLTLGPAKVERLFICGPPLGSVGVTVVVTICGEELTMGVTAIARALPNPDEVTAGFGLALTELVACLADREAGGR